MTDQVTISRELLPCPFCGGHAELSQLTRKRWSVDCDDCSAAIISCADKQGAIDNWNTRAAVAPKQEACQHEWVSADNSRVQGCEICTKCKTIRAAQLLSSSDLQHAPIGIDSEGGSCD